MIPIEAKTNNGWENAIVGTNESFFTIDEGFTENNWQDFALLPNENTRGNVILKAFTEKDNENNATQPTPPTTEIDNNTNNNQMSKASNFDSANAFVTDVKIDEQNNVTEMTMKVSNIKIGDKDDKYTYYYCILETSDSTQIKNNYWQEIPADNVKIGEDGSCELLFHINLNEQVNLDIFRNSEKIYLHLKEKAEVDNQQLETIHVLDIQYNIDNVNRIAEVSPVQNIYVNPTDDTVANKILPKTGKLNIIIGMGLILGVSAFCYIRYRNIDK